MDRKNHQKIAPAPALAWAGLAARLLIGSMLVFSGMLKRAAPTEEFAVVIENYQIVGTDAAQSLAALLPWAEIALGLALIFGYFTSVASAAAGSLLLVFIIAILSTKARGIDLPNCGCFGDRFHPAPMTTVVIDTAAVLAAVAAYLYGRLRLSLDNWSDGGYT